MDPRLLRYYNRELQHLREVGTEFAREFPKVAGRLGLDEFECTDPYVERLFEGFAFLAARVQLKLDAQFPALTQHLLEALYPHYLAPTPSMTVVQFQPDSQQGNLAEGFTVPRGSLLRSQLAKGEQTPCEYRTAQDVVLYPLTVAEAQYLPNQGAISSAGGPALPGIRAGLRLRLKTTAPLNIQALTLDRLPIFVQGVGEIPYRLHELMASATQAVVLLPGQRPVDWQETIRDNPARPLGFAREESLLPLRPRAFRGYTLLQEYFAFPERFLFVELTSLQAGVRRCATPELDILWLFNRADPPLTHTVDEGNFALFCSPAANLFPKRTDRLLIDPCRDEQHIVVDRTRPLDFEVHSLQAVTGFGTQVGDEVEFLPLYGLKPLPTPGRPPAYYTLRREKRVLSARQRRQGARSSYVGSECYIALVDPSEAPYPGHLRQLGLEAWCTNRDLPLTLPVAAGHTDFTLQSGAPVTAIRCLAGPTKPRPSVAEGTTAWRLLNHLSLNYLSLVDNNPTEGAAALREMLGLYGDMTDPSVRRQVEGVLSVRSRNIVRRIDPRGPIVFGRGLGITLEFDPAAFEGMGFYLLGSVLEYFLSAFASINSFTETSIRGADRGETILWPTRIGQRHTL